MKNKHGPRYRVRARLWAILAERRMQHAQLAQQVGVTQQWVSYVYRHPDQTVDGAFAHAVADALSVPLRRLFVRTETPWSRYTPGDDETVTGVSRAA